MDPLELPKRFTSEWWKNHYLMFSCIAVTASGVAFSALPIFV